MKTIWSALALLLMSMQVLAQTYNEKISKEFSFEKKTADNAVMVANINGNIRVEGYAGDKIILEVDKSIRAKTNERLEQGKTQIQLGVLDLVDTLIFYVQGTEAQFGRKSEGNNGKSWSRNEYGYNWCCNGNRNCNTDCDCHLQFDYKMDFVLKVPANVHLLVSTINDGNIDIARVKGAVKADNINGSIKLTDLVREANVSTINGDVDIEYISNPKKDCRFYTLNGDINAWFQKGLAASLSFESFNGSLYTNIEKLETLPVQVEKKSEAKGVKYKVNDNRFKVGPGGAFLDFETFNGDVYLKERTN
jgi:DUF4097 and DUF4098 domain-containing protein YvlB